MFSIRKFGLYLKIKLAKNRLSWSLSEATWRLINTAVLEKKQDMVQVNQPNNGLNRLWFLLTSFLIISVTEEYCQILERDWIQGNKHFFPNIFGYNLSLSPHPCILLSFLSFQTLTAASQFLSVHIASQDMSRQACPKTCSIKIS